MSSTLQAAEAIVHAECADCGWTLDRSLDAGETLSPEDNQEIVERTARSHAYKCGSDGPKAWGEYVADVDVTIAATGGGRP